MTSHQLEFEAARRDVVFGRGGDRDLLCDIYLPAESSKRMAIIHLHGGGFRGGSKDSMAAKVQAYVRRGYVCIAAQYRLSGEAKWPAQLEDVMRCIRWVRASAAELGIEPERIAVAGYSAGGHLAMMASATRGQDDASEGVTSDVAACFAYFPPAEVRRASDDSPHQLMTESSTDDDYRGASPLHTISSRSAPTVLFHGTADVTVLPEASQQLYDALIAAGVPAELHTFHGVPHEFDHHPEFSEQCASLADLFLDHMVINRRTYPPFAPRAQPAPA